MSRSAAARADHDHAVRAPRGRSPAIARRVSGAAHAPRARLDPRAPEWSDVANAPRHRMPSRPPLRLAAGGASLVLRVAGTAMDVSSSRTMDRLVRSRGWVLIVAFGLIGIVAMQVSLLKLNAGIGRAVETAATLERGNATLRGEISRLSSGDRVQALAGARGFVMPEPADVTYLRAGDLRATAARAARLLRAPSRATAGPAGSAVAQPPPALVAAGGAPATAPAAAPAAAPVATAPAAAATPMSVPAPGHIDAPPVGAAPAAVAPQAAPSGGVTVP